MAPGNCQRHSRAPCRLSVTCFRFWHPYTQMKRHEHLSSIAVARELGLAGWIVNTLAPGMAFATRNADAIKPRMDRQYCALLLGTISHLGGKNTDDAATYANVNALLGRLRTTSPYIGWQIIPSW